MEEMRLIVAGGREFTNFYVARKTICGVLLHTSFDDVVVVNGGARGADTMGKKFADTYDIRSKLFPANWDKFGKRAGYMRNEQMAEYGTHLIAFWDEKSKGTKHMIKRAQAWGIFIAVFDYHGTCLEEYK